MTYKNMSVSYLANGMFVATKGKTVLFSTNGVSWAKTLREQRDLFLEHIHTLSGKNEALDLKLNMYKTASFFERIRYAFTGMME